MTKTPSEVAKLHFLGAVDYAQHNFARLRPLLYSESGRVWDGLAERSWFPHEGLVFTHHADLRWSAQNSLWTFRLAPNAKGEAVEKDVWSAVQAKPAIELLVGIEPEDIEASRIRAMETGLAQVPVGKGGVAVPELYERWIVIPELEREEDGQARPSPTINLKHLKVLVGSPEEICGRATPGGQYALPPIPRQSGEARNWQPPNQFLETLAQDLRRWVGHGPHRAKAQAAAQALRDLAPHLSGIAALKAEDAKIAIARAHNLTDAAETITGAAEVILDLVVHQEPFKASIAERRRVLELELETEALRAVEQVEGAARDRLRTEQAALRSEIEAGQVLLGQLKAEISILTDQTQKLRDSRVENVDSLHAEVDAILERAATEPARMLAEWIGVTGFVVCNSGVREGGAPPADSVPIPVSEVEDSNVIAPEVLGAALFRASPASGEGDPPLPIIDAALRARELPVLIGPMAREFAEAWLSVAGGDPIGVPTDPTLLSLMDLTPRGQRGEHAPLAEAFARAASRPEPVIVLLDDLDPAAASFWLPDLARCLRHPGRFGFPANLHVLAVIEADPAQMSLTRARASELFPLTFEGFDAHGITPTFPERPHNLPHHLFCNPATDGQWPGRVAAFERSLGFTFQPEKARSLAAEFAGYLRSGKVAEPKAKSISAERLEARLDRAAQCLIRKAGAQ